MKETAAVQLKNWFPQPGFVEVRKGCKYHAWDLGSSPKTVSAIDTGTDTFTSNSHGYADGTQVKFHAATTMPVGLSATRVYYIISTATNTFQVSRTAGGAAVNVTSGGSGTITVYKVDEPLVETLALWQGPASSKMFAAAGGAFWDVTTAGAGTFSRTAGGLSNRWQWCNHTTSAGAFLFLVNGSDAPLHYNGTTWTAPSITGITPADIVHVVSHKKRLWFTIKDTTKAAYLGTEAVAGAATEFQFGGLFSRGGYLLACATWTRDGGAGADDLFVALSSRGQAAVYQGTDPSSANTWELVGVFDIPTPVGRRCFTRFGGDLLLITVEGLFPLSQLLAVDQSQVDRVAISDRISNAFNTAAIDYSSNFGWECCVYPKGTRLLVNIPTAEDDTAKQYVMNTLTGAWCEFEGWDAITFAVFNDNLYFSGPEGDVYRADTGRADVDNPISATGQTAYSVLGTAQVKRFSMMRPLITATGSNRPSLGVSLDFVETSAMSALSASSAASDALWDSGVWDTAVWGGADVEISDWVNVVGLGTFGSIKFAASTGVDSGGSLWGVTQWTTGSVWGSSLWGSQALESETMRIQGFVILAEVGEYL
jgi:DNA-binding protein YbaB